ncbi:hypothetical protein CTheo_4520 [Ceratobasidium theobromae]|uniref:Uncharacterized protein n=1 Tax=Ceratobasidium theobromae TaxID=1582974 RepID=A0A5N5QKN9_9AGAM|nr:hypothetical protein CTheo_4520 [Ceratobasidium theobromae]
MTYGIQTLATFPGFQNGALLSTTTPPVNTVPTMGATSGSGPNSGPDNKSGSGSSSGSSGETARPNASQTASESITFTFSSKNSPFAHLSPPGSVTFVSARRRGSDSSRDRSHRRQQGSSSSYGPGWVTLSPLKPMTDEAPFFEAPRTAQAPQEVGRDTNTAVFSSRAAPQTRQTPRLSLVAQHHHATFTHPFFNSPPQLVTPPPLDPFTQLKRPERDGYFPPMPPAKGQPSSKKSSRPSTRPHRPILEQPQPSRPLPRTSSSRTPNTNAVTSQSTPRALSRADPGTSRAKDPALIPIARTTPPQRQAPPGKSITPPRSQQIQSRDQQSPSPQPSRSIDAFRDCFGVLTRVENVFPARPNAHSGSGGSENVNVMGSAGPGLSDFQRRWTKRWIRRTLRGVGSMGSGSTSLGSAGTGLGRSKRKADQAVADTMVYLGLDNDARAQELASGPGGSGSQDSLDRVRVSRSNAPSPASSGISGGSVAATASAVAAAIATKLSDQGKENVIDIKVRAPETAEPAQTIVA